MGIGKLGKIGCFTLWNGRYRFYNVKAPRATSVILVTTEAAISKELRCLHATR